MKNSINVIIISIILGLVLIGALIAFGKKSKDDNLKLPIEVEEYADFQCPACGQFYTTANKIKEIEGVEFTYRHFPLTSIHDRAYQAAIASEAAREQGKFDEYHDMLYENQQSLQDDDFYKYAEDLNLDMEKFKDDYQNNLDLKDRVDTNIKLGENYGVNSTPTLIVNGERFTILGKEEDQIISELTEMVQKAKANEIDPIESPAPTTSDEPTEQVEPTETVENNE